MCMKNSRKDVDFLSIFCIFILKSIPSITILKITQKF